MAYRALYRKWRPDTFDTVIGQSHITETIRNELLSGHLAHAYLFTGTRGTGKTSTAKILSRAVNCLLPINGNPCNECENCKSILNDTCLDVMEIDAASNTGVDNIRDIIEQLQYLPSMGKYKVYIIDEVHMLSQGAFNALLKTLEEPPAHVIFILATTEVQKIPATILSRCQRFDFKTISIFDIVSNIKNILISEHITADDDALEYVAFLGDGSMRDSLSILDQCLAFKPDNLTVSDVTGIVGAVDDAVLYDFASDISESNISSVLHRFNDCVNSGKNFDNIAKGLLQVFREILMFKINSDDFAVSKLKKQLLKKTADKFDVPSLVRYINIMTECISSFKTFSSQRVLCECALIKLATPQLNTDLDSLLSRLDSLENRLTSMKNKQFLTSDATAGQSYQDDIPLPSEPPIYPDIPPIPESENNLVDNDCIHDDNVSEVINRWNEVMSAITSAGQLRIFTALYDVEPFFSDGKLILRVSDNDRLHFLNQKENINLITKYVEDVTRHSVTVLITGISEYSSVSGDDIFKSIEDKFKL